MAPHSVCRGQTGSVNRNMNNPLVKDMSLTHSRGPCAYRTMKGEFCFVSFLCIGMYILIYAFIIINV